MVARAKKNGAQLVVAPETSIGMLADVSKTGTDYLPFICSISRMREFDNRWQPDKRVI